MSRKRKLYILLSIIVIILMTYLTIVSAINFTRSFYIGPNSIYGLLNPADGYVFQISVYNDRYSFWGKFAKIENIEFYEHHFKLADVWINQGAVNGIIVDNKFDFNDPHLQPVQGESLNENFKDFLFHVRRVNPKPSTQNSITYVFIMNYRFLGIPCRYVEIIVRE